MRTVGGWDLETALLVAAFIGVVTCQWTLHTSEVRLDSREIMLENIIWYTSKISLNKRYYQD